MSLPLASDYPLLDVIWSMLVFVGFVMWIWLAIMVFIDIFRRHDIGGFLKAIWILIVILIPIFGVLIYLLAYHNGVAERSAKEQQQAQQAFDARVREAAGPTSAADEIDKAQKLLASGAITQEEFDHLKAKALAGSAS